MRPTASCGSRSDTLGPGTEGAGIEPVQGIHQVRIPAARSPVIASHRQSNFAMRSRNSTFQFADRLALSVDALLRLLAHLEQSLPALLKFEPSGG